MLGVVHDTKIYSMVISSMTVTDAVTFQGPVHNPICPYSLNVFKHLGFTGDWDYERYFGTDDFVEDDDDDYSGRYLADSEEQYIVIDDDADVDESEMPDDGFHDDDEEQRDIMRQV